MKKILFLFFVFLVVSSISTYAGNGTNDSALHTKVAQWLNNNNGIRFLENKGQMFDQQRKPVPNVLYEASGGGMNVYVTTSGLSYVFVDLKRYKKKNSTRINFKHINDSITETWCRADMQLVGSSIKKENIIQEGESADRSDYYYGGICPNGILGVHSYTKVTVKNIYPGIDWVLHSGKYGLKYDFIVHPGANPSLIKLKYKWTNKPQLQEDGSVKITTPMGNITEGIPVSYSNGEKVQTTYTVNDSEINFNVGDYNTAQTLIIDPKLVWATYYGVGPTDVDIFSMHDDGANIWLTGTGVANELPTYNPGNGAYFQGTCIPRVVNAVIIQFTNAGVLQWATYYGGSVGDVPESINGDGTNVWVTGYTESKDFPVYNPGGGAYFQGVLPGYISVFILQFDTKGVRKWATYYGGSDADKGYSIQSDGVSVWVTGAVTSTDFPVLNPGGGAYFQGTLAARVGTFILQFNMAGVPQWATYYAGEFESTGNGIQSDGRNVWVTGWTEDNAFPLLNPGNGAYFQAVNAASSAFLLKFNTKGVCKWATYYGGSLSDAGSYIYSDSSNVWVTGQATSSDFPTYNPGGGAYFQGTIGSATGNAFILKFDTAGVRKWATYYGGNSTFIGDEGFVIQSDRKHVWVSGASYSLQFPLYNPGCGFFEDSVLPPHCGNPFLLEFDLSGVRKWATYYGVDMEDDGSFIWSDGTNIFVAGDDESGSCPTVNPGGGAYYDSVPLVGELVWVGKFIPTAGGLSTNPVAAICRGDSTMLSATGAISYNWNPPAGLSNTRIANPYAKPKVTTTYTVTGVDTGICGGTYKDSITVVVDTLRVALSNDTNICSGSSITLKASGGASYKWNTGSTTSSISIIDDSVSATLTVKITNGVCQRDTSVKVTVVPLPKPVIAGTPFKCLGLTDTLAVSSSVNPTTYKWANGSTSTSVITGKLTHDTTIYVTAFNNLGCPVKDSFEIGVTLPPAISVNPPTVACSGNQVLLKATTKDKGTLTYLWTPGGKTTDTITVNPGILTSYSVTVSNGCDTIATTWVLPDNPTLAACCDHIIFAGDDTIMVAHSPGAKKYEWIPQVTCLNPSCDSVQVSPTVTTTYTVTSTDSAGCQVERIITIVVDMPCADFVVPNVFTPDNAGLLGLNNLFYIKTFNIASWSITIYDVGERKCSTLTTPPNIGMATPKAVAKLPMECIITSFMLPAGAHHSKKMDICS